MGRILVIDDDNVIRLMIRHILEREGYEVTEAADGHEGLKLNRQCPADLIITDILMPDKEGIETIRDLKTECPNAVIIAISGGGRIGPEPYLKMAADFGAAATISKPIESEHLVKVVKQYLPK